MSDPILLICIIVIVILGAVIALLLGRKTKGEDPELRQRMDQFDRNLAKVEAGLANEFGRNREEFGRAAKESRDDTAKAFAHWNGLFDEKFKGMVELTTKNGKDGREELASSLKSFETRFEAAVKAWGETQRLQLGEVSKRQEDLTAKTEAKLEQMRVNIEGKLTAIQNDNNQKLEKMRETVDEKLHKTLETRLGESFKLVSERLELVQKGLGEMQTLATGVGDLKKVLSNVKTKGVLGEYQLENLLEQLLTPDQYGKNVKTRPGSGDMVEFAVKIPHKNEKDRVVWLPIDAKFPTADYEALLAAYEAGDPGALDTARRNLETKVKVFAKDIRNKYIEPPHTTDFAILFLPFEGLYAEVLRIGGLFESLQREQKITIAGPTTLSAFLNSLQMGFRSLAVEQRTSEVWDLLGAVRTEFGKFGDVLEKTKERLDQASRDIDQAGVRSRVIEKKLRNVESLPQAEAGKLLE